MLPTALNYTLCRTRDDAPLVEIDTPLGNGQELTPEQLRRLAAALLTIADEAASKEMGRQYWVQKCRMNI